LTILQGLATVAASIPAPIAQLGGSVLATSKILGAFGVDATKGFDGLSDKVKSATGASEKMKAGFAGLAAGALNPAFLATGVLSIALMELGRRQQEAAQKAADHAASVRDLTSAMNEDGGAIGSATRQTIAKSLADKDAVNNAKALGVSYTSVASAAEGNSGATQDLVGHQTALIQSYVKSGALTAEQADILGRNTNFLIANGGAAADVTHNWGNLTEAQQNQIIAGENLIGAVGEQAKSLRDVAAFTQQTQAAFQGLTREQQLTQQTSSTLASTFTTLGDATGDAKTQVTALQTALDILTGRVPTHEEALQTMNDTLRSMGDELGKNIDKSQGFGAALVNADGTVNTATANGSKLQDSLVQLQGGFAQTAQSINGLVAQGMPLAQAQAQVNGELVAARQHFIDNATAMGLSAQQAQTLADKYGLIPAVAETAVLQPGMLDAIHNAGVAADAVRDIPNQWTVTVDGLTQQAEANLNNLGFHVTHMPNGQVAIQANTAGAQSAIDGFIIRNQGRTINITTTVTDASGGKHVSTSRMNAAGGMVGQGKVGHVAMAGGGSINSALGGGFVSGPGSKVSDSVLLSASAHEYVINAAQTSRYRPVLDQINAGTYSGGSAGAAPVIDYGAMAAAVAQAVGAVLSAGVSATFDSTTLEKGLISLQRQRNRR
jgi:hypothetical protein